MRTKALFLSLGLAASAWSTGCQNSGPFKPYSTGPLASGSSDYNRTSTDKQLRAANRPATKTPGKLASNSGPLGAAKMSTRPPAKVETVVIAETPAKGVAAASCSSCPASTIVAAGTPAGTPASSSALAIPTTLPPSSTVAQTSASIPVAPAVPTSLPSAPAVQVASVPVEAVPMTSPPVGVTFGQGVEVVPSDPGTAVTSLPGERITGDNMMTVRFGHANNYQIVVGQVYQFRRAWKLRYTAVESDDKYGGSFTLVGDNLDNLKDGQMVRVEGAILSTDDRVGGVRYQVNRVEVLEPDLK